MIFEIKKSALIITNEATTTETKIVIVVIYVSFLEGT